MAVVRSVTVGMGRTYNMGDYESFRIEGAITVDLEPGDTPEDAARKSFPILRAQMKDTFKEFKPVRKADK